MNAREIERVFLLDRMPEEIPGAILERAETWLVEQGYFAPPPDSTVPPVDPAPEGRIRRVLLDDGSEVFTHTIKSGVGLVREERERVIPCEEFRELWPLTRGRRLRKTRLRFEVDGQVWELDRFHDLDSELVLAEAELPAVDTPLVVPPWIARHLVREVTEEPRFRNFHLAGSAGLPGLEE